MLKKDSSLQSTTTNYSKELDKTLYKIGDLSITDFAKKFPSPNYLENISWDPTKAKFWNELNGQNRPKNLKNKTAATRKNTGVNSKTTVASRVREELSKTSFRDLKLSEAEKDILKKNGFVVSKRLGADSFGSSLYQVYTADLPVFISTDLLLHAWHCSFDAVLEEVEGTYIKVVLEEILLAMLNQIPNAFSEYGNGVLKESLVDADYFLAVASSLLKGNVLLPTDLTFWIPPKLPSEWELKADWESNNYFLKSKDNQKQYPISRDEHNLLVWFGENFAIFGKDFTIHDFFICTGSAVELDVVEDLVQKLVSWEIIKLEPPTPNYFGQEQRIKATLEAIFSETIQSIPLFGRNRAIDFSQFKPRAKYSKTKELQNYFRAMMWLGRIDLQIVGLPQHASSSELGAAIVLYDLLKKSGKFKEWQSIDNFLQSFFGKIDSMTFNDMESLLKEMKLNSPKDIKDLNFLQKQQANINETTLGFQQLSSGIYQSPEGNEQKLIPRSFTFMGQRFTLDSWAMSKVVFDNVYWQNKKVLRKIPSSLDVAFSVFGNTQVSPQIITQIINPLGRVLRDGLSYQHNLLAIKEIIDKEGQEIWEENLYSAWLATLRELSSPTTGTEYPEAMRTKAWAMRTLNTQLASWTQLKHDSILYVKQPESLMAGCMYPAGYVEPRPDFWKQFGKMAKLAAKFIEQMPTLELPSGKIEIIYETDALGWQEAVEGKPYLLSDLQRNQIQFFQNFAKHLAILEEISRKELSQSALNKEETLFLEDVVEVCRGSGDAKFNGWYPTLFYKGIYECANEDLIVADVFTNTPDPELGDPGCVLHQAIGYPNLMIVGIEQGLDKVLYLGPVFSYYEFEMPGATRKADAEWEIEVKVSRRNDAVEPPKWTKNFRC